MAASERDDETRARWRERVALLDPGRLVFVDECGSNVGLAPLRARAPKGEQALGKAPRNRGKNTTTLLASMSVGGMGLSLAVEGSTTKAVFEAYVGSVLAPSLRPGQVVVMDNLSAHKGERVRSAGVGGPPRGGRVPRPRRFRRARGRGIRRRERRREGARGRPPGGLGVKKPR